GAGGNPVRIFDVISGNLSECDWSRCCHSTLIGWPRTERWNLTITMMRKSGRTNDARTLPAKRRAMTQAMIDASSISLGSACEIAYAGASMMSQTTNEIAESRKTIPTEGM